MTSPGTPQRIQCVSETCDYEIDPNWDFCPYCGVDNRPPSRRSEPIPRHSHRFLHRSGCCLICGEPIDEPYYFRRRWRMRIATALLIISVASLLIAINIGLAGAGMPAIAKEYVKSWYDQPTRHFGRRTFRPRYSTLGRDLVTDFVILGVGSGLLGALMLFKQPLRWFDKRDGW
jgi:hypothetical protein